MDAEYANYYTREVMLILIREFQSPDEEMKKIVLKVCQNDSLALRLNRYLKKKSKPNKSKKIPSHTLHYIKIVGFLFQVVKQCCGTDGVEANYIKTEILPPFFKHFWQHRMALDRRNYRQVFLVVFFLAGKLLTVEEN